MTGATDEDDDEHATDQQEKTTATEPGGWDIVPTARYPVGARAVVDGSLHRQWKGRAAARPNAPTMPFRRRLFCEGL